MTNESNNQISTFDEMDFEEQPKVNAKEVKEVKFSPFSQSMPVQPQKPYAVQEATPIEDNPYLAMMQEELNSKVK